MTFKIMLYILLQMEFYFSDSNLHKDRFLKKAIEASVDGCKYSHCNNDNSKDLDRLDFQA